MKRGYATKMIAMRYVAVDASYAFMSARSMNVRIAVGLVSLRMCVMVV
jgi:hypothetical protein